jgi:hypothetical protein
MGFQEKPLITLAGELAQIAEQDGSSAHKRAMTELQAQLKRYHNNPNTDPADQLANEWGKDKTGKLWTRDRIAALIAWALKIRKETDALHEPAMALFLEVLSTGHTPDWFKDFQ